MVDATLTSTAVKSSKRTLMESLYVVNAHTSVDGGAVAT